MTDTSVATIEQPSPHQIAARDRSAPKRVTGRLKTALDLMVWQGLTDSEAAVSAKMNVLSIRLALNKRHVRDYLNSQRDVLLSREGPRNIHAMIEVRDQKTNHMARVAAVKALEQLEEVASSPSSRGHQLQAPGFMIQVIVQQPSHMPHVQSTEPKPLIEHESGRDADGERDA